MTRARTAIFLVFKSDVLRILNLISLCGLLFEAAYFFVAGAGAHHHENDHHDRETYGVAERRKRSGK